jgi:3-oxoacyl-[acyl-carrier protein] reductase
MGTIDNDKSDLFFKSKRILVTGATGGIGKRVCQGLVSQKASLVVLSRPSEKLKSLEQAINADGSCVAVPIDFSAHNSVENAIQTIGEKTEALDGAVIIVPSVPKSSEIIPSSSEWLNALNLCFVNPLMLLRGCLPLFSANARIVIVSGIASVQVFPELAFSNVIRTSWLAETKLLSHRLGDRQIRVNTLSLGGTLTERFCARVAKRTSHDVPSEDRPENIPLGHYCDPDDAAGMIVSLLSSFSNHLTGTNIVCDGGLTKMY